MTKSAAATLSDEELTAELERRNRERQEAAVSAQKEALKPLLDIGFGDKKIDTMIADIGNAMPAFVEDHALYQVLANVRIVLEGANQAISARIRQIDAPPIAV